ncbi:major facilitator superfamily domain-containing protein [Geopyxis carbonaria]|nr:major facilitator superfamily domain-containing protein [Geopyxis carbonaria]
MLHEPYETSSTRMRALPLLHDHRDEDESRPLMVSPVGNSSNVDGDDDDGAELDGAADGLDGLDEELELGKTDRAFVRRLDLWLVSYVWLSYCMKQLDASSHRTAYISGMRTALHLHGNELNALDASFRLGYALFLLPSSYLLSLLLWGLTTALMAFARPGHPHALYVLRFLTGAFEASAYPGYTTLLMSWYTPAELAPRLGAFATSYPAAAAFSGALQAALHTALHGRGGVEGWRWLFAASGLLTAVVAAAGFAVLPDQGQRRWWMPADSRVRGLHTAGKMGSGEGWWHTARRTLASPTFWAAAAAYCAWSWAQNANAWFGVYLSTLRPPLSVAAINTLPIPAYLFSCVLLVVVPILSKPPHTIAIVVPQLIHATACVTLALWPEKRGAQMLAWHALFVSAASGPLVLARLAERWKGDEARRRVGVAVMVLAVYAVDAATTVWWWPVSEAPRYRWGWWVAAGMALCSAGVAGRWEWRGKGVW